jgi:hypothetical protein
MRKLPGASGTLVREEHLSETVPAPTEDVSTGDTHGHISFLAMITPDSSIQPLLPQVLLGNEHQFTQKLMREVRAVTPENFVLLRRQSGWNCHEVMRQVLTLLAKNLKEVMKKRHVILLLDVHSSHLHRSIFAHARRLGIQLVYIPAALTFMLQPCDTHLFARLKTALREAWRNARLQGDGKISSEEWLMMIFSCARKVMQGTRWRGAFQNTGALAKQEQISPKTFYRMGLRVRPRVPSGPPTKEEAALVFPKRRKLNVMTYVMWCAAKDLSCAATSSEVAAVAAVASSHSASAASSSKAAPLAELEPPSVEHSTKPASLPAKALKWVLRPRGAKGSASAIAPALD